MPGISLSITLLLLVLHLQNRFGSVDPSSDNGGKRQNGDGKGRGQKGDGKKCGKFASRALGNGRHWLNY